MKTTLSVFALLLSATLVNAAEPPGLASKAKSAIERAERAKPAEMIVVGEVSARKVDDQSRKYVAYSWQVQIKNPTDKDAQVAPLFEMFDVQGFQIASDRAAAMIPAGQTVTVSRRSIIERKVWAKKSTFKVTP